MDEVTSGRIFQFKKKKNHRVGRLCGSVVERLPFAQILILGSWDRVLHQPASPSACVSASLCVSFMNNQNLKKKSQGYPLRGKRLPPFLVRAISFPLIFWLSPSWPL